MHATLRLHFRKKKKDIAIIPKIHGDKEHHKNIYRVFWTQMRTHTTPMATPTKTEEQLRSSPNEPRHVPH